MSLIVDPVGETVLPGSLASEIGVTASAEDPIVVQTIDGVRVTARRKKLRSVRVDRYEAVDSPCLVLVEGGAEVEPRLGRATPRPVRGHDRRRERDLILGEVKPQSPAPRPLPPKPGEAQPRPPSTGAASVRAGQASIRAHD